MTDWQGKFEALGVNVAAMTYDDASVLAEFGAAEDVSYPLLSDKGAKHVNALGIRNEKYDEDHPGYGIAHPGVLFVDEGVIRLKRALPDYRSRPPFDELFEAVAALVRAGGSSDSQG